MRRALVVGIDYYQHASCLHGCVNDAHAVTQVLERHGDGSINFSVKLMTANDAHPLTRAELKDCADSLFADDCEVALFYFAGHGSIESTGGYLLTSEIVRADEGIPLNDLLEFANRSRAKNKVIILDSCHSGITGSPPNLNGRADLAEGITILTASTKEQYASEENGNGIFTALFIDALNGAASNLMGAITPGSVYAHIDQSLGPWEQRPVFKTNVKNFISLRYVPPAIELADLRKLTELFPSPGFQFQLDPSFEPERSDTEIGVPPPNPENTARFFILQKYNRVSLVVPVGAPHMYHAAMESKSCRLTALGEHYRRLVAGRKI